MLTSFGRRFSRITTLQTRNFAKKKTKRKKETVFRVGVFQAAELIKKYARTTRPNVPINCHLFLNMDPRKKLNNVKSVYPLPHATETYTKIAVLTSDPECYPYCEAEGFKYGGDEFVDELIANPTEIDYTQIIATLDMYDAVKQRLGRVLGPIDLMPSERMKTLVGSVEELKDAVEGFRRGKVKLFSGRDGDLEFIVGRMNLSVQELYENLVGALSHIQEEDLGQGGKQRTVRLLKLSSQYGLSVGINPKFASVRNITNGAEDWIFNTVENNLATRSAYLDELRVAQGKEPMCISNKDVEEEITLAA